MADRDSKGRFIKGHKPFIGNNPGRKPKATEDKYLRVFSDTVTDKDLEEILQTVMARAKAADMVAARIIFDYALGKPRQQVTVEGDIGFQFPTIVEVRKRKDTDKPPPGAE